MNIQQIRNDTRACKNIIHFNNAGAALMPAPVANILHEYLHSEEQIGGYETQTKYQAQLENFYTATSKLINCKPSEVAFIENHTRAWDMAFYSFNFSAGDKILTTISEYGSNVIAYLHQAQRHGVELVFVPNDQFGQIDTVALENMIDDQVKLISINHIPTGGGLVNPVQEVGRIANTTNIPFLLDACQSLGQLDIDVQQIGCDILTGTGRKFLRGPRATGLLYVKQSFIEQLNPPFLDQHAAELISPSEYEIRKDAKRFENWEQNFSGKAALATAIDYALQLSLSSIEKRIEMLANQLRSELTNINGITIEDEGINKCGIVTFQSKTKTADEIKKRLADHLINVSTISGSGSLVSFQNRGIQSLVRASLHYYNTDKEILEFMRVLSKLHANT